jgi:hypothetical protein
MQQINWKELFEKTKVRQPIYYALSGSHLYGFNSPDSDIDIRGCHIEPLYEVIGLHREKEVREQTIGEIDFVSFDIRKEMTLMLANNSNVLEHLAADTVYKSKHHARLKALAEKSISKLVAKPYYGMAQFNTHKYLHTFNESYREAPVKKYLYVLRAYMAGIYALGSGRIEPNIKKLNAMRRFQIPIVDELVRLKVEGEEKTEMMENKEADEALTFLQKWFHEAEDSSSLPNSPQTFEEANDFLLELRTEGGL